MLKSSPVQRRPLLPAVTMVVAAALALSLPGCLPGRQSAGLPDPSSSGYADLVTAFYTGLAALDGNPASGTIKLSDTETVNAPDLFKKATDLAPGEPATWADLGLVQLRLNQMDAAAKSLTTAQSLAPDSPAIEVLLALLYRQQGQFAQAMDHLKNAIKLNPRDLKTQYALMDVTEQQGGPGPDTMAKVQAVLDDMLKLQPDNMFLLVEQARVAAARGDKARLQQTLSKLARFKSSWSPEALEMFKTVQATASGSNVTAAAVQAKMLGNVLKPVVYYREAQTAAMPNPQVLGEPLERFLKLPSPGAAPAAPDTALTFAATPLSAAGAGPWPVLRPVWLMSAGLPSPAAAGINPSQPVKPVILVANGSQVSQADAPGIKLSFPGGTAAEPPGPDGILALDWDWDFKTDLVLAGAGGVRLYRQTAAGKFDDMTAKSGLPAAVTSTPLFGAWAADTDADSDLDIVLGTRSGPPIVLRNNRDGTFKAIQPFANVSGLRAFAWGDFDGDGDADAGLVDAQGKLHVFTNDRSGLFHERPVPASIGPVAAVTVADVNGDGLLDLVLLQRDGAIRRLSDKADGSDWDVVDLAKWANPPAALDHGAQLFVQDLDNNGGVDLVASAPATAAKGKAQLTQIWLMDAKGAFAPLSTPVNASACAVADVNGDGRLDLTGLTDAGQPVQLVNKGTKNYHWQVIRPVAGMAAGKRLEAVDSQGINSYGIGGEISLRSALSYQKQPILGPVVHFGLGDIPGDQKQMTVARAVWPNGAAQAEFRLNTDQHLLMVQRIQTSCPFLFTWDGKQMHFVTDCIWRSPLGLKINAQDTAGTMQTQDWLKIRGDQLVPRNGLYDLRITAELWETHFFDYLGLMSVDHPAGTDIWVDERMAIPQPPLKVYATKPARPFARAWDDRGRDVSDTVRARDGKYLAGFGHGIFRGVTRDHWVAAELGPDVPHDKPLWLIANGWIRPTNSSINVALGQGHHDPPRGLSLEVTDANGHWVVAKPGLGFPEGKVKTILISLDGVFRPGAPRRLRLRTNLEIFWDSLAWAEGLPRAPLKEQRLPLSHADLHYRGFSELAAKDDISPEMPVSYDRLGTTAQRWRDLTGFYTRFGDVRELLTGIDDRYVIMNAGDELSLQYPARPAPPAGWVRDYIMMGDGWVKDGDYNTTYSKTVLPLPAHDRPNYDTPRRLEDDPVYQRHKRDWQVYHTRYVTPDEFQKAFVPRSRR